MSNNTKFHFVHFSVYATLAIFIAYSYLFFMFRLMPNSFSESYHNFYTYTYGFVALFGSVPGFIVSRYFGGLKSVLGKSLFFFSLGLLFQFLGQVTFFYYSFFLGIENPYPSLMEVFYFGSLPIYIYAIFLMGLASGSSFMLKRSKWYYSLVVIVPVLMVWLAYYLFLTDYDFADTSSLVVFLDFGYPILQAVQVSIAIITFFLTRKMLGGYTKFSVLLIILALIAQYIADLIYTLRTYAETWMAGGISDFLYLISYFSLAVALYSFYRAMDKLNSTYKNVKNT